MILITEEQRNLMLENGQEYARNPAFNPLPVVKLFDPHGGGTCLLTDLDPEDNDISNGLCDLGFGFPELGSVRISEMEAMKRVHSRLGVGIERDLYFKPDKTISEYANEAMQRHRISA